MSFEVAVAIGPFPGTIHGTTPTPSGKITGHSVMISHSARVNALSVGGSTNVSAMRFTGCAW